MGKPLSTFIIRQSSRDLSLSGKCVDRCLIPVAEQSLLPIQSITITTQPNRMGRGRTQIAINLHGREIRIAKRRARNTIHIQLDVTQFATNEQLSSCIYSAIYLSIDWRRFRQMGTDEKNPHSSIQICVHLCPMMWWLCDYCAFSSS